MKYLLSSSSLATSLSLQSSALFSLAAVHGGEMVEFSPHTFTLPDGYALQRVVVL